MSTRLPAILAGLAAAFTASPASAHWYHTSWSHHHHQQTVRPVGFAPVGFAPTGFAPVGFAPTGFTPTGFAPTGFAPTGFTPTGFTPTGFTMVGLTPTGTAPTGTAPTGAGFTDLLALLPLLPKKDAAPVKPTTGVTAAEIEKLLNDRLKITDDKIDAVLKLNTPTLDSLVQKEVAKQLADFDAKLDKKLDAKFEELKKLLPKKEGK